MDFSESYKASLGPPPCYSPDGRYIASCVEYRLIIREVESLRIVQLYSCLDRIDSVEWASSSLYILCAMHARAIVQVWSVDQPEWTCKIDEGPAGLSRALWSPDGLSILVVAAFNIRTTVWSLAERRCTYLRGPKMSGKGLAFSPADAKLLAVLERYDCKDHITLYSTSNWQQLAHFPTDTTDAADLAWSPDGTYLAVRDTCLTHKVQVFTADGKPAANYSADIDTLGVKDCSWNGSGELLAVGSFDQKCRVLNHVTWLPLMECSHPSKLEQPQHVVVYQEADEQTGAVSMPLKLPSVKETRSKYVITELPAQVPVVQPALDQPNPRLGVGTQRWSPDSQFLATLNENMPHSVWVWDMAAMELSAVLTHGSHIRDLQWSPKGCTLAITTGCGKVYLWTPGGASIVHIPLRGFAAHKICWGPKGGNFVLTDKDAFCCAYITS